MIVLIGKFKEIFFLIPDWGLIDEQKDFEKQTLRIVSFIYYLFGREGQNYKCNVDLLEVKTKSKIVVGKLFQLLHDLYLNDFLKLTILYLVLILIEILWSGF